MRFVAAGVLLVGAVVLHFFALYFGVYDAQLRAGFVWFDNVLHTMVGVAFGLLWLSILHRVRPHSGVLFKIVTALLFVLGMAIAWELFELAFYLVFKSGALGLKVYSPSLREAVFDSISNITGVGALLVLAWLSGKLTAQGSE